MSMEKAIIHHKEYRKPYRGSKAFDCTCRNHGSCQWCKENRLINSIRKKEKMKQIEKDYLDNDKIIWYN